MGLAGADMWEKAGDPEVMAATREYEKRTQENERQRQKESDKVLGIPSDDELKKHAEQTQNVTKRTSTQRGRSSVSTSRVSANAAEQRNAERGRPTIHIPD